MNCRGTRRARAHRPDDGRKFVNVRLPLKLTAVLNIRPEAIYAGLFEASPASDGRAGGGNLVFTGDDDDPATVETLVAHGLCPARRGHQGSCAAGIFGRFAAVRSAQAREMLTELTPALLRAIAQSGDGDATLFAFDRFVAGLPGRHPAVFAAATPMPGLMRLLVLILSTAPRLAAIITRRPHVFDGLLDPSRSPPARRRVSSYASGWQSRPGHPPTATKRCSMPPGYFCRRAENS